MKKVKRYSEMLVTIMVIVLAGYAGMASGSVTWDPEDCNVYDKYGNYRGNVINGCCQSETENSPLLITSCPDGATTCNLSVDANNTWTLECY